MVASSSPTATALRQHLATVASTVRASAPASSPATWKSVLAAPVSGLAVVGESRVITGPRHGLCGWLGAAASADCAPLLPAALTFREEQCAAYNHRPDLVRGLLAPQDWVPRYSGVSEQDQCKLICQSQTLGYYHVLQPRVSVPSPAGRPRMPPAGAETVLCRRWLTGHPARLRAQGCVCRVAASPLVVTASSAPRRSLINA